MQTVHSAIRKLSLYTFLILTVSAMIAATLSTIVPQKTSALSGSEFNPERIIDDVIFTNNASMSVGDIQNFLNAKVPSCDSNGTGDSGHWNASAGRNYTRAEWGALKGYPAPFTCLRNYYENTTTGQNNGAGGVSVSNGKSAAQIIWDAAQAYKINPQVILTTLQKEQGLVTDVWPWENQYNFAMGYGCPDTSSCSNSYRGFATQVDHAAWQSRYYLDHPYAYNYWIGNYYVRYNPDANCGGKIINIRNAATAALYIYTPYQPNTAALNSLTGSGDNCSAYGIRNFWYYFNTWFGSSQAPNLSWQVMSKSSFADNTKAKGVGEWQFVSGKRYYMQIKARNTGNVTWQKGVGGKQVNVGTTGPRDRTSAFYDSTWLNAARPATMTESSVAPGEVGTFEFWLKAPSPRISDEGFSLVMDGSGWLNDPGLYWHITTAWPSPAWEPIQKYIYSDSTMTKGVAENAMIAGQRYYVKIIGRNVGNIPWQKGVQYNQVNMGTTGPQDRKSPFCDSTWISPNGCARAATTNESVVNPGETATWQFWVTAPKDSTSFIEGFNPVMDGTAWLNNPGLYWKFGVSWVTPRWEPVSKLSWTSSAKTQGINETQLHVGQRYYMQIKARNTSNVTWERGVANRQVNIGTTGPNDRVSPFCDTTWLNTKCTRTATTLEDKVAPGEVGTFEFWVKAPTTPGVYIEGFNPVMDGAGWMNNPGLYWRYTVSP
jgi:hypothetical protein